MTEHGQELKMEKSDLLCVIKYKNKNIRRYRGRSKVIKK